VRLPGLHDRSTPSPSPAVPNLRRFVPPGEADLEAFDELVLAGDLELQDDGGSGASRSIVPDSTSCMTAVAVMGLASEAVR
jgi:hypothetical protein